MKFETRVNRQVAMAHAPADEAPIPDGYSAADEFFIYKFSKEQAGLSGLAFDEGIFGVCGYVTEVHCLNCHCLLQSTRVSCLLLQAWTSLPANPVLQQKQSHSSGPRLMQHS